MSHQFNLKIDPILGTGLVLLNRNPLFAQSQLQICSTQNFFDWYRNLPTLMYAEINDSYSVAVECPTLAFELLCAVLGPAGECQNLTHTPVDLHYSVQERFTWLTEAAAKLNCRLPEVPHFSIQTGCGPTPGDRSIEHSLPAFYRQYCTSGVCQVNIWLTHSADTGTVPMNQVTENDFILCDDADGQRVELAQIPIFHRKKSDWAATIIRWVDQMILLPYLMHCQELLLRRLGKAPFDVESRVQMLSRDEPYVVLHIPSRLECGTAAPLRLEEFPLSSLSLKISNPQVLRQQNDQLLAGKAGTATVSILSERGSILCQESMDVYFVKRVTSITLNAANNGTFLQGDTFRINSVCLPQGSANLSSAVWTASPAGALRNHGDGRFTALMPGKCTVCLTIGKVSQTLGLNIMPLATDLQLPGEIRFKVNAPAQKVTAALLPHNTGCKEIRCRTIDGSVAQWNPNTKSIVPIAEGTTRLEATVIGPAGNVLFQKQCPVVILPEKDIVTPPTFLTLAICCAIIAALVIQSSVEAFIAIETCAVALFLCAFVISTVTCVKGHSGRSGPIQAIISLAGALLGAIFLFSIF